MIEGGNGIVEDSDGTCLGSCGRIAGGGITGVGSGGRDVGQVATGVGGGWLGWQHRDWRWHKEVSQC